MRLITIDTETTGLLYYEGHKIIEIGCVEIINNSITKNVYHTYINPCRNINIEAKRVTGLTESFLNDKPKFKDIINDFLKFIEKSDHLIMHNAKFDINFINNELKFIDNNIKHIEKHFNIIDTLELARKLHPGKKNNLDVLCKRYNINLSGREMHGALIDATLLAELYIKMNKKNLKINFNNSYTFPNNIKITKLKQYKINKTDLKKHKAYIKRINKK